MVNSCYYRNGFNSLIGCYRMLTVIDGLLSVLPAINEVNSERILMLKNCY